MADDDANARRGILSSRISSRVWNVVRKVSRRSTHGFAIPAAISECAARCQTCETGSVSCARRNASRGSVSSAKAASISLKPGFDSASGRFPRAPRAKLSMPATRSPFRRKRSARWLAIKPATPVRRMCAIQFSCLVIRKSAGFRAAVPRSRWAARAMKCRGTPSNSEILRSRGKQGHKTETVIIALLGGARRCRYPT